MKKSYSIILLTILISMVGVKAYAYDIAVENADGKTIYYNYINDGIELEVTRGGYSGVINIPETVTYMNRTRIVTSIGHSAFEYCSGLTSVTIPNSVTTIGELAFVYCSGLISVTIGNSVSSIGSNAFAGCSDLKKVIVKDIAAWCEVNFGNYQSNPLCYAHHLYSDEETEITNLVIPNSVTTIGEWAFYDCSAMTSVTIGNSVTTIGRSAFMGCSALTSATIGNSVTTIGESAFHGCSAMTSVTIGNSVTAIGELAYYGCSGLKKVIVKNIAAWCGVNFGKYQSNPLCYAHHLYSDEETEITNLVIPNSVKTIGNNAFAECSGLTSVTIPNSVTNIGSYAFGDIDMPTVISLIESPFTISSYVFSLNTRNNATLYVPTGTIDKYKTTAGWNEFLFMEEGNGGTTPTLQKCEKPAITYQNGKLTFSCDTEGATCQSTITNSDITSYSSNEVQLGVTYNISVYATKTGYENSDVATATLCWIDVEPRTEGLGSSVSQISANAVLIQAENGQIAVTGADDGTKISVYDVSGRQVGSATSIGANANINTNMSSGSIAIVKIGEKSVKVVVK